MKQKRINGHYKNTRQKLQLKGYIAKMFVFLILFLSTIIMALPVDADGGMIPYNDFNVYEPGQKAIIGWNGEEEVMILSVDVYSEQSTKALHMVPLQSLPEVELGSVDSFEKIEQLTGIKSDSLWGGRPDIVLEKYDENDNLVSILMGEVKYTQDKGYAIQGLKELLEYMALIKSSGIYVEKYKDLFTKPKKLKGGLFLDFMGDDRLEISGDESVFAVMFGEDDVLSTQIQKWDGLNAR